MQKGVGLCCGVFTLFLFKNSLFFPLSSVLGEEGRQILPFVGTNLGGRNLTIGA